MVQQELLSKIIRKLNASGIPYMLTGSMASNYYGNPRMTHDIDIVIQLSQNDIETIGTLFEKDYYLSKEALAQAVASQGMFNLIDSAIGMKVDFWLVKNDPYYQQAFARRKQVHTLGETVSIIAPEDLMISKRLWAKQSGGSAKQDADIQGIQNVQNEHLDKAYLQRWQEKLGLDKSS